jgi:hypothetical protein
MHLFVNNMADPDISDYEFDADDLYLKICKVHVFRHLFVCFQTSVYTLGEFHKNRNNSTVIP